MNASRLYEIQFVQLMARALHVAQMPKSSHFQLNLLRFLHSHKPFWTIELFIDTTKSVEAELSWFAIIKLKIRNLHKTRLNFSFFLAISKFQFMSCQRMLKLSLLSLGCNNIAPHN